MHKSSYLFRSSPDLTQVEGDAMCLLFCAQEVHVVGNQKPPGPDHCCPPLGNKLEGPKSGDHSGFVSCVWSECVRVRCVECSISLRDG